MAWNLRNSNYVRIRKLVLDVLKPRDPPIYELASRLAECRGVSDVDINLAEIDQRTETIKVSLEGDGIDINEVRQCIEELGASVQSFDEVRVSRENLDRG
ncbi:MAG: DUF211 domain-containing protein [Candidatus Bathyarchaeia archaeon]